MEDRIASPALWRELYEAACEGRRREKAVANWYKRRAREAERSRRRIVNGVLGVLTGLGSMACVASWVMMIVGG